MTYSKIMAWYAVDRSIRDAERLGYDAPLNRWRALRDRIHARVCRDGFDAQRGVFSQSFGSPELDASLLLIPQLGFLPADDPRVLATVGAIERDLVSEGLVLRYRTDRTSDGLADGENCFVPCSVWLASAQFLIGKKSEAGELFEQLLALRNDLGLLSEEYDPREREQIGNFPQAYSHLALIGTALTLSDEGLNRQAR